MASPTCITETRTLSHELDLIRPIPFLCQSLFGHEDTALLVPARMADRQQVVQCPWQHPLVPKLELQAHWHRSAPCLLKCLNGSLPRDMPAEQSAATFHLQGAKGPSLFQMYADQGSQPASEAYLPRAPLRSRSVSNFAGAYLMKTDIGAGMKCSMH